MKFGDGISKGSSIDLRSDLGIAARDWGSCWEIGFREDNLRVALRYEEITLRGEKTLPKTLAFDETTFVAGSFAQSQLQYDEVGLDFEAIEGLAENLWGWAGFSASLLLVEPQIATAATGADDDLIVSFAPGARAGAEWIFWGPMRLGGEIQIDLFNYESAFRLESMLRGGVETYLACDLGSYGKLLAGYRARAMILENRDTFLEDNAARLTFAGFFVSLAIRF